MADTRKKVLTSQLANAPQRPFAKGTGGATKVATTETDEERDAREFGQSQMDHAIANGRDAANPNADQWAQLNKNKPGSGEAMRQQYRGFYKYWTGNDPEKDFPVSAPQRPTIKPTK